jgi:Serine/threonine protein phosphatase
MNITIGKPYASCEKGGRPNNEDSIYPLPETISNNQTLFIVCDGVGGANKGEIASAMACELFHAYLSSFMEGELSPEIIKKALQYTEVHFDDYIVEHPEAAGMATTMTMAYFGNTGITIAHIGDSRIYHFRKGQILHQTEDHSLVNSLLKLNVISKDDMRSHPQRNVILRAIQGTKNPTEADVALLNDIEAGDYIFMCTDGVLELFTDESLKDLFSGHLTAPNIKDAIIEACSGKTKDNFSFYLIPIQNVHDNPSLTQNIRSFFYSLV